MTRLYFSNILQQGHYFYISVERARSCVCIQVGEGHISVFTFRHKAIDSARTRSYIPRIGAFVFKVIHSYMK